jgi:hypothetical protein
VNVRRLATAASTLLIAVGAAGCDTGNRLDHPHIADNEGFYVDGGPITYQVQLTRELNPNDTTEDAEYLTGLPAGIPNPKPDEEWFAVFLWAKNQSRQTATTAGNFDIVDTEGNVYRAVALSTTANPYAWTPTALRPGDVQPAPNTTASEGPTQGEELLFKLNTSVYADRPLTLEIRDDTGTVVATTSLDL